MHPDLEKGIREAETIFCHRVIPLAKLQTPRHPKPITFPRVHDFLKSVTHNPHGRHRKKRIHATARYRGKVITYNPLWLEDESYEYAFTVDLVLHELGHLFSWEFLGESGHGQAWKRVGHVVGYTPIGGTRAEKRRQHPCFAAHVGKLDIAEKMLGKVQATPGNRRRPLYGVKQSTVDSPVYRCRKFFEENPNLTRAEAVEELVALGINRNTASTQYWRWNNHGL